MIDLYSWATPNGHKIHIMLEECGLSYRAHPVDIGQGDQFKAEFLALNPNHRIPAITDSAGPDGKPISLFESGAILLYLAGKTGKFVGKTDRERYTTLQWLMFQMGGVGPMLGQTHHFRNYAPEKIAYAINRYTNETRRLYGVMDGQLGKAPYIAGRAYTIADMAIWPWLRNWQGQGQNMDDHPNLKRWYELVGKRPAVQRGVQVLADLRKPQMDERAKEILFGATQYAKR